MTQGKRDMRLLVTSDWHLDATTAGLDRLGELEDFSRGLEVVVEREEVDVVLHLGDLLDPGHLDESRYQRVLLGCAARLTKAAKYGSVWLAGNHDVIDTDVPTSTLSPLAMVAEEWWGGHGDLYNQLRVLELPRFFTLGTVSFLALPYVARTAMQTPEYQRAYVDAVSAASAVGAPHERIAPLVVLSHLSLPGMHPEAAGEPRGREVSFPVEDVRAMRPDLVLQGHYHARQVVQLGDGLQVQVVGAPVRFNFGERQDGERGYLMVDL